MTVGPLAGIRVVEVAVGVSDVGAGLAAHLPGIVLRDLGAHVTHVRDAQRPALDAGLEMHRAWDAGKDVVEVGDDAAAVVRGLCADADVVLLVGPLAEALTYDELAALNPALVQVRVETSRDALGPVPDLDLLVAARAGVLTQIRGHRPGPVFPDLNVASAGAALVATVGALAGLVERAGTGRGGWFATSLLDGVHALLPMITGRVENHSGATRLLWERQGPGESLAYRCRDGGYVQLWFGAKGAYEAFLERVGEPPSAAGYQAELISGAMADRDLRWKELFAQKDRDEWLTELAGQDFRCEPVWWPGEALRDAHVREVGLAVAHDEITTLGPIVRVTSTGGSRAPVAPSRLLEGVRILDLSAYLAGPVAARVLAELGADVVKVEPPTGDVHRSMEPMFGAGQQRKRAVALDLKNPKPPDGLTRLFAWADVVHHNSRVGLAERLGYDEPAVRAANADAIYCHASGFGPTGPRATLPANDQLMQALAGIEAAQGGAGNPPTYLVWGAVDVASGWLSACGILAALFARRTRGGGQSVDTSLLGGAMLLKSGAFLRGDEVVRGPVLDSAQTGYGAAYRIYRCADDAWLALAAPDVSSWSALVAATGAQLPVSPPALRTSTGHADDVERTLEAVFATRPRDAWVDALRTAGVPVEPVPDLDRTGFIERAVGDEVNVSLGRVHVFSWGERGRTEVMGGALRSGPEPLPPRREGIPGLGEHTAEVLAEAKA
ncbi:MAG TPA: CoA transferase [Mycobacteriales bacterium]|nr:CoA transferase [Mycobacteriales bacterium]